MDFSALKEDAIKSIYEQERAKEPRLISDPALWEKATLAVQEINDSLTTTMQAGYLTLIQLYNQKKEEINGQEWTPIPFLEPGFFSTKTVDEKGLEKLENYEENIAEYYAIDESSLLRSYNLLLAFFEKEQYESAVKALFFLNFIYPGCPEFLNGLGHAEYKIAHYQEAASFFVLAYSAGANDPDALRYAAFCFNQLGDRDSATQCLNLAREQMTHC